MNRFSRLTSTVTLSAGVFLLSSEAFAQSKFAPGRILVGFTKNVSAAEAAATVKKHGALKATGKVKMLLDGRVALANVPKGAERAIANRLSKLAGKSNVAFAELDGVVKADATPNDPYLGSQWHLQTTQAPTAWDTTTGSPSIIVAVIDTGVDATHPELASRMVSGYNTYNGNTDSSDVHGHGTKVAGSAVANSNNGSGIASLCWQCGIMPIRATDTAGYATYSSLAAGIDFAARNRARVANLSFQAYDSSTVRTAADNFAKVGGITTISAGNAGALVSNQPHPSILTVASTNSADVKSGFSNYGAAISVSAPGEGIFTTTKGGGYGSVSGTSFAAPITAGVAALVLSANPQLTSAQVIQIIKDSADDLGTAGWDSNFGFGRVNAAKAVAMAKSTLTDTTAPQVAFTSPGAGATLSNTVSANISASDNAQVASVTLFLNNAQFGSDTTAPYSFALDTTKLANGTHTLLAIARDSSGNENSSQITVAVSNQVAPVDTIAPVATITTPTAGARFSNKLTVSGTYTDNVAVTKVEILLDGRVVGTSTTSPFSVNLNTRRIAAGTHTLQARAYDAQGNVGLSQIVTVTK